MYFFLADGAISHESTTIIAKLIMIARSKIAILLILPTLPACAQLARLTSRRSTLIVRIDPTIIEIFCFAYPEHHLINDFLLLSASAPRTKLA